MRFRPDLIVETTMLCDRRCRGCYAPTVLAGRTAPSENAFLQLDSLTSALAVLPLPLPEAALCIAVRGGEPTLHPHLPDLMVPLRGLTTLLYLETNGHWILENDHVLLQMCTRLGVIVKISFDSMHTLKSRQLYAACSRLEEREIRWVVAITEATEQEYHESLAECSWLEDHSVIFQPKATRPETLIKPPLGVIHPDGTITSQLSTKALLSYHGARPPSI